MGIAPVLRAHCKDIPKTTPTGPGVSKKTFLFWKRALRPENGPYDPKDDGPFAPAGQPYGARRLRLG